MRGLRWLLTLLLAPGAPLAPHRASRHRERQGVWIGRCGTCAVVTSVDRGHSAGLRAADETLRRHYATTHPEVDFPAPAR